MKRMKQIVKEWALSEKNPHTTRRKPRPITDDDVESISTNPTCNNGLGVNVDAQASALLLNSIDGTTLTENDGYGVIRPTTSSSNCLHQDSCMPSSEPQKGLSKSAHPRSSSPSFETIPYTDGRAGDEIEE